MIDNLYFISRKEEGVHDFSIFGWNDYGDPVFFVFSQDWENPHLTVLNNDGSHNISKLFLTRDSFEAEILKRKLEAQRFGGAKLFVRKVISL